MSTWRSKRNKGMTGENRGKMKGWMGARKGKKMDKWIDKEKRNRIVWDKGGRKKKGRKVRGREEGGRKEGRERTNSFPRRLSCAVQARCVARGVVSTHYITHGYILQHRDI